jgi:hypothetical protein
MSDNSVAALAVLCIFGAPVAAFIVIRVLAHRERIEMIRRGMVPPQRGFRPERSFGDAPPGPSPAPRSTSGWVPGSGAWDDAPARSSLRKGIMLALIGLAILIGLSFIGYDTNGPFNSPEFHPGPWLLGGLIPMFVGIAQIIVAVLSGAGLGPPGRRSEPPPYLGGPGPSAGAPPGARSYEPEPRTHSGYEELQRPVPPPDRR